MLFPCQTETHPSYYHPRQGRRQWGAKGAIAPPFSRDKEQNLQLTCVELALQSFKLDFVDLSWTLAGARPQKIAAYKKASYFQHQERATRVFASCQYAHFTHNQVQSPELQSLISGRGFRQTKFRARIIAYDALPPLSKNPGYAPGNQHCGSISALLEATKLAIQLAILLWVHKSEGGPIFCHV